MNLSRFKYGYSHLYIIKNELKNVKQKIKVNFLSKNPHPKRSMFLILIFHLTRSPLRPRDHHTLW